MLIFIVIAIAVLGCIRLSNSKLDEYMQDLLLGNLARKSISLVPHGSQNNTTEIQSSTAYSKLYFLAGMILLVIGFLMIESIDPNYFVQDDALVTELPGLIYFCRSVFNGQFPEYNPYILLGAPGWSSGGGGTYPILYPAYLLSVLMFDTEYNTLDVLAFIHMLAGYVAMFVLARRIGLSPPLALLATLSFLFSGSILITGRCWHAFHALSFYLPVIFLGVHEFAYGKFSWRWVVAEGILIGMLYHAGFPQAWMLTMLLAGIAAFVLILALKLPFTQSRKLMPMLLIGAAIVYPLYAQQSGLAKDLVMQSGYGAGLDYQILGILLPYPLIQLPIPNGWGSTFHEYGGHFSYFGTLLAIGACCATTFVFTTWIGKRLSAVYAEYVWAICCFISFLLAMGDAGYLWWAIKILPAGMSNHPFRCYSLFVFFATLSGGLFFQHLTQNQKHSQLIQNVLSIVGLLLVFYHLQFVRAGFYNYGFRPYPELAEVIKQQVKQDPEGMHRIITYAPDRSIDPLFPYALPLSLPALYEVPAIHGYDPLTENKAPFRKALELLRNQPVAALNEYGIKWALVHNRGLQLQAMLRNGKLTFETPYVSPWAKITIHYFNSIPYELSPTVYFPSFLAVFDQYTQEKYAFVEHKLAETEGNVSLIQLREARPLAFFPNKTTEKVLVQLRADGLNLTLPPTTESADQKLIINFLVYPQLQLSANGKQFPITADEWGRISAQIPANVTTLELRYVTPWGQSMLFGGGLLLIALVALWYFEAKTVAPVKIP